MKRPAFLLLLLVSVVFWNVENYLAPTPERHWTYKRFAAKSNLIAKSILAMSDSLGNPPAAVGIAEVENERCLRHLTSETILRKFGYNYIHYDSPDRRGIDCALLYRGEPPLAASAHILLDAAGDTIRTRSILLVEFSYADIMVVHLPSKLSSTSAERRLVAYRKISSIADSLYALGHRRIVVMGDFNEPPAETPPGILSPLEETLPSQQGSIRFDGRWELIDRCFAMPGVVGSVNVFESPMLSVPDKRYGGVKPFRTYVGPRYQGGASDHYPIRIEINW